MKKTLLVTIDFPPAVGGVATYWKQVAESFPVEKLVVLTIPGESINDSDQVIRKSLFFAFLWPKWMRGIWHIWKTYKKYNCEQILIGQVLPVGSMVYFLNKVKKIPFIVQVYGMDLLQAKRSPRKERLAKRILHQADSIIANSNYVADLVSEFCHTKKQVVTVYPVPASFPKPTDQTKKALREEYGLQKKTVVLTVGRLVERKGHDKVLGAMMHVWQSHQDVVYVIVGDGPMKKKLQKMAEPHKPKVIFTGKVSEKEKNAWLNIADIFIMPARESKEDVEGFGIVYLEAGAQGVPVIAGDLSGPREAVLHQKTGLLVDPEDIDDIAKALLRLIEHPGYAKELGEGGQKRLLDELSWKNESKKLENILS